MPLVRKLLTVSLLLASSVASADKITRLNYDRSLGIGLVGVTYEPDEGDSFSMPGVMLTAGYEFTPRFSVEARLGSTGEDEGTAFGGTVPISFRINLLGGVFAKYSWIYGQKQGWARFYGLLGGSYVAAQVEGQGETARDNDSGLGYGLGLDLFGSDRTAIVLEWVRYLQTDDYTIDAPMVGVVRRF